MDNTDILNFIKEKCETKNSPVNIAQKERKRNYLVFFSIIFMLLLFSIVKEMIRREEK